MEEDLARAENSRFDKFLGGPQTLATPQSYRKNTSKIKVGADASDVAMGNIALLTDCQ